MWNITQANIVHLIFEEYRFCTGMRVFMNTSRVGRNSSKPRVCPNNGTEIEHR